jgi:hypothetical protein
MTVKIQSTTLLQQPTSVTWNQPESKGKNGFGAGIYSAFKSCELAWDFLSVDAFNQLTTFYGLAGITGTVSVTLPKFGAATYVDYTYSGCVVDAPTVGELFEQHYSGATLVIRKIRA